MTPNEEVVKEDVLHLEVEENSKDVDNVIAKPESIRDSSPEELKELETRMVRKIDLVIMYVPLATLLQYQFGIRSCVLILILSTQGLLWASSIFLTVCQNLQALSKQD